VLAARQQWVAFERGIGHKMNKKSIYAIGFHKHHVGVLSKSEGLQKWLTSCSKEFQVQLMYVAIISQEN
jgi:hypothetical protein